MFKERELIKDMKILLECTDMGGLQRNADNLIGRAIELLAQPEQESVAWYWEDSDLDDPEWIAMADTGDKPIEHRLRRNIQPLYLAPQKSAEAEFEQAIKDTIDTEKLMQILKDGGILIEEEQINELVQEQEPSSDDYYKNIELRKEVQTKSQTKQEPKVCPNKMRNGSCPLPDPLCGYPNCEK